MMQEFFQQYFFAVLVLIALVVALTIFVFRKRKFDRGYRKGVAADEQQVKRENRPDEWSRSH
jgi:hypothetical protein